MGASVQIAIAVFGSGACFIVSLIIVAILIRLVGAKQDTAAEDHKSLLAGQKTLLERIERLRERPVAQQFIIINSTRHDILGAWAGHIRKDGMPVPAGKKMYETLQKHPGVDVEILVLKRGVGSLLSALPIGQTTRTGG